jgi:hypothetical protein
LLEEANTTQGCRADDDDDDLWPPNKLRFSVQTKSWNTEIQSLLAFLDLPKWHILKLH